MLAVVNAMTTYFKVIPSASDIVEYILPLLKGDTKNFVLTLVNMNISSELATCAVFTQLLDKNKIQDAADLRE